MRTREPKPVPAPARRKRPPPPAPARTSRTFLVFVVLFILASLGASVFLLQRIIPLPIHLHL